MSKHVHKYTDCLSGDGTQHLKVDIRNDPISEEDTAAQNAAFSSVANVLRAVSVKITYPRINLMFTASWPYTAETRNSPWPTGCSEHCICS